MASPAPTTIVSTTSRHPTRDALKRTPFFQHPVAVFLSIVLATLLIVLIHKNLENQEIFRGEVDVVSASTPKGRQIVVGVPADFVVDLDTTQTNLIIRGVSKDKPTNPVVDAFIPTPRLEDLKDDWKTVTLANEDLSIQGLRSLRFSMNPPVSVRVARMKEGKVILKWRVDSQDPDLRHEITPSKLEVTLRAPAPFFGDANQRTVDIHIKDQPEPQEILQVPWQETGRDLRLPDPVVVTVKTTAVPKTAFLVVKEVPIVFLKRPGSPYEARVEDGQPGADTDDVKIFGSAAAIQNARADGDLRNQLVVMYRFEDLARDKADQIKAAGDQGWSTPISGKVSMDVVKRLGFDRAELMRQTRNIIIRLRK